MIRHADQVREYIRVGALPSFLPAIDWDESDRPFTDLDSNIIYCRQEGRPVDAFVRQVSVTVTLFSKANASNSDLNQLFDDAVAALEFAKLNPNLSDEVKITVTRDVSGPYQTGQNRRYFSFQVLCYSS